jgi:putative ABC transport system permease protein
VAIISEDIKKQYFGDVGPVVGKYIEADNVNYRVLGVVKSVPVTDYMFYSDIYLPYTVSKGGDYKSKGYSGGYMGVLLANSASDVPKMHEEYEALVKRIPPERKDYTQIHSHANTFLYAFLDTGNDGKSGVMIVITAISLFVFIFTLLPTLNLVNINITRIMERSSEIGMRKAFGASSKTLVYQFIVENLILTLLGGILGTVLAGIVLYAINHADLIANLELTINFTVLFIGVLLCVVFGFVSGVYPAWRMSKLNVVTALKAQ